MVTPSEVDKQCARNTHVRPCISTQTCLVAFVLKLQSRVAKTNTDSLIYLHFTFLFKLCSWQLGHIKVTCLPISVEETYFLLLRHVLCWRLWTNAGWASRETAGSCWGAPKAGRGAKWPFSLSASGGFFQGSESHKNPRWG